LMVEAGLVRLQIGGESGDQRILDVYDKGVRLKEIVAVVEQATSADLLSILVNFIVGGAFETLETYERTREFALDLLRRAPGRAAVGKSFYTPYPGTPIYEDPGSYGLQVLDWDAVTGQIDKHVFCRTEQLSRQQILALGQDFDEQKDETMRELALRLPSELIERHFRAEHRWALSTEWHEFLARDPAMRNYFHAVVRVGALGLQQAEARAFAGCYPMRTVEPVSPTGQNYAIQGLLGREQHLEPLESLVFELSAGKLSFEEILSRIADRLSVRDATDLRDEIVACYRRFDRDYLVVWPTTV
jgi:anaerobic magnesium-protoporphyrin IX monomethyl ester cyclase